MSHEEMTVQVTPFLRRTYLLEGAAFVTAHLRMLASGFRVYVG